MKAIVLLIQLTSDEVWNVMGESITYETVRNNHNAMQQLQKDAVENEYISNDVNVDGMLKHIHGARKEDRTEILLNFETFFVNSMFVTGK